MSIKKVLIMGVLFFASLPLYAASPLDGTWKGTISLGEGRIDYDLILTIKTDGTKTLVEAQTNYAKLHVTYADVVTLEDETQLDLEAYELTQDVYFNFTFAGTLQKGEDTLRGSASQAIQNRRYLTSYGTFEVKRVLF